MKREGPRRLVNRALGKVRALVDEENYSGFTIGPSDLEELARLLRRDDKAEEIRRWLKRKLKLYVGSWIVGELEQASQKLGQKTDRLERLVGAAYDAGLTPARLAAKLSLDLKQTGDNIGLVIKAAAARGDTVEWLEEALDLR
jgi:predicted nucleic acid-binding protein